ncbi:hypothetical protein Q427_09325 [Halomonas sp. BC04]|nr:hypothetical protein Q427_09325 [Halomonas sp. BC04]
MDAVTDPIDLHARLKPRLLPRPRNKALYARAQAEGLTELQARVLAGRLANYEGELAPLTQPSLRYLEHPERLADGAAPPSASPRPWWMVSTSASSPTTTSTGLPPTW